MHGEATISLVSTSIVGRVDDEEVGEMIALASLLSKTAQEEGVRSSSTEMVKASIPSFRALEK